MTVSSVCDRFDFSLFLVRIDTLFYSLVPIADVVLTANRAGAPAY